MQARKFVFSHFFWDVFFRPVSEDVTVAAKPISVRPPQRVEPKIIQIAKELDKSSGQFLSDAAEAIIAMIEAPVPRIPRLVAAARVLRENRATFADPERPFPPEKRNVTLTEFLQPDEKPISETARSGPRQKQRRVKTAR